MLKLLESIRCYLWRGVNSCLTWLRIVRRDGRKCACLFFIHDMFGWKYTSPIFPYIPPLTRNCILTTHFRDYDQICWWHGLLRRVTSASPGEGSFVKESWKFGIVHRLSSIVWVLAHAPNYFGFTFVTYHYPSYIVWVLARAIIRLHWKPHF